MIYLNSIGHFAPENPVTNDDLASFMDTSDDWIQTRSGIRQRFWVRQGNQIFKGMRNQELSVQAARDALEKINLSVSEIDLICYATISPDNEMPGSGVLFKKLLGIKNSIPVVEIRNQCSGFIYAIQVARGFVMNKRAKKVLVVGSEIQSSGLDLSTRGRNTSVLFADGAGVAVISADKAGIQAKLISVKLKSEGIYSEKLGIKVPGFLNECMIKAEDFEGEAPGIYPQMEGKFIFKSASTRMPEIVREIIADSGLSMDQLKVVVPHQANLRIIEMLSANLGTGVRVFSNIQKYGNTTAASIPIALSEASKSSFITKGDLVCLVSFGAGFSWGAALVQW